MSGGHKNCHIKNKINSLKKNIHLMNENCGVEKMAPFGILDPL
jgi:hypothetical protein